MLITKGMEIERPEIIPTPSMGLNYILDGGLWTGRQHVFWGPSQVGKSTFALHVLATAQEMGYTPVIIDAEQSLMTPKKYGLFEWVTKCGIEPPYHVIENVILEDILKQIVPMMKKKGEKYVFLFDSINGMVMEQFYKEDESTGAIGIYARTQKVLMQKMANEMGPNHMSILIAQQAKKKGGKDMIDAGSYGNAVHHWSTNIVKLFSSDAKGNVTTDTDGRIMKREVHWKIEKSKQGPVQGTMGSYFVSLKTAELDQVQELFSLAVKNGIIEQRGAWYYYGDEKYHGEASMLEVMTEDLRDQIAKELFEKESLSFEIEEVVH